MNIERLRFFAGIAALLLVVACAIAGLFCSVSGRSFADLTPVLGWVGGVTATLFAYSGLAGKIEAVHKQVNGNLEREVARADNAVAELTTITRAVTGVSEPGRHRSNADQNDS